MTRRGALIALGGLLIAVFLVNLPVINQPFGRDQGIYAYIGDGLNHGLAPYRDAWDHKPPGVYFVYALAFRLFGREMASVHLFESFWIVLTTVLTYALGARLAGRRAGLWAAAFYGFGATLLFNWWDRAQAEMYMGAPILAAALAVAYAYRIRGTTEDTESPEWARERGRADSKGVWPLLLLAGVFAGLSLYLKPTNAAVAAALGVFVVWQAWVHGTGWSGRSVSVVRDEAALGAGFVLAFVPLVAWFAWQGALNDLVQTVIVFNTYHVQTGDTPTLERALWGTLDFGSRMSLLGPLGVLGTVVAVSCKPRRAGWLLLVVLIGAMGGVWLQGKFFSYHWSPALPGLALLAALAVEGLLGELRAHSAPGFVSADPPTAVDGATGIVGGISGMNPSAGRTSVVPALVLGAIIVVYVGTWLGTASLGYVRDVGYMAGTLDRESYLGYFGHNLLGRDVYSFRAAQDTAEYLRANTSPDDSVLVWGFQALVNFLAERRAPTRYVFNYPLTFEQPESEFRRQARATFLDDLETHQPLYIVLVTNDVNPLQTVDSMTLLKEFPEFQAYIAAHYKLERDIADFHLYRRTG